MSSSVPPHSNVGDGGNDRGNDSLKVRLSHAINSIDVTRHFAFSHQIVQSPPLVYIDGVGDIEMPLGEDQLGRLGRLAGVVATPRGYVQRNPLELDASVVLCQDPKWPTFVDSVCGMASQGLGLNAVVTANLHKMFIFRDGPLDQTNFGTYEGPKPFGTLVITLPTDHQGGDIHLKNNRTAKSYRTSMSPQSFACWYSDVSHAVTPVTSGRLCILTFRLTLDLTKPRPPMVSRNPILSQAVDQAQTARRILKEWVTKCRWAREHQRLYHVLKLRYTKTPLSLDSLVRGDLALVQVLKDVAKQHGVEVFFGTLELHRIRPTEGEGYTSQGTEIINRFNGKVLSDSEGHLIAADFVVNFHDIIQEDCFVGLEPDRVVVADEHEGGGTSSWYHRTAAIFIPRDTILDVFGSFDRGMVNKKLAWQIGYLSRCCQMQDAPQPWSLRLDNLINILLEKKNVSDPSAANRGRAPFKMILSGETLANVFKFLLQRDKYVSFDRLAPFHYGHLPLDFFVWLKDRIRSGQQAHQFSYLARGLSTVITSYPHLSNKLLAVLNVAPMPIMWNFVLKWVRSLLLEILTSIQPPTLSMRDGAALADISMYYESPVHIYNERVVPLVRHSKQPSAVLFGFLGRLDHYASEGPVPRPTCLFLYGIVTTSFLATIDLARLYVHGQPAPPFPNPRTQVGGLEIETRVAVDVETLASFLHISVASYTNEGYLTWSVTSKILSEVSRFTASSLETLWVPALIRLVERLKPVGYPLEATPYNCLFQAILRSHTTHYLGPKPPLNPLSGNTGQDCSCKSCIELNRFLDNPSRSVWTRYASVVECMHLSDRLREAKIPVRCVFSEGGSGCSVVVTKADSVARNEWNDRRMVLVERFATMEITALITWLGPQVYTLVATGEPEGPPRPSYDRPGGGGAAECDISGGLVVPGVAADGMDVCPIGGVLTTSSSGNFSASASRFSVAPASRFSVASAFGMPPPVAGVPTGFAPPVSVAHVPSVFATQAPTFAFARAPIVPSGRVPAMSSVQAPVVPAIQMSAGQEPVAIAAEALVVLAHEVSASQVPGVSVAEAPVAAPTEMMDLMGE